MIEYISDIFFKGSKVHFQVQGSKFKVNVDLTVNFETWNPEHY